MRAGRLDRRITVEQFTSTVNAMGEPIMTWTALATLWASVRAKSAREFFAHGEQATADVAFKIRYRSDLNRTMRIAYGGDTYDIVAITEIGRREALEIIATAKVE